MREKCWQHGLILPECERVGEKIRRLFIATMRERIHGLWLVWRRRARGVQRGVAGLLQTWKTVSTGYGWSIADVRDSVHRVSTVCRSSARWGSWVVVALLQKCKKVSKWCDWSVVVVREGVCMVREINIDN